MYKGLYQSCDFLGVTHIAVFLKSCDATAKIFWFNTRRIKDNYIIDRCLFFFTVSLISFIFFKYISEMLIFIFDWCIFIADLPYQKIQVEQPKVVNASKHENKKLITRISHNKS